MKKLVISAVLLSTVAISALAAEVRYYAVSNQAANAPGYFAAFCAGNFPGSEFFGVRGGDSSYTYIACRKP